ncbi:MAG: zinc ribbon domain-containing protein [Clostridiales bacterium]|nr:zinc ribbon domain-containing protein [Clostridiales bacterium]
MNCPYCGAPVAPGQTICGACGRNLPQQAAPTQNYYAAPQSTYNSMPIQSAGYTSDQYKPLSPWAYIGYNLLFSIPLVGFIMMIVFAVDSTGNINRRNYARSFLLVMAIALVLSLIFVILAFAFGFAYDIM